MVAAAAAFQSNTSGWWKSRAYHCTTLSRKRYFYRSFASNDGDTTFSIASTNKAKIKSYYLRVKTPEEMVRTLYLYSSLTLPHFVPSSSS